MKQIKPRTSLFVFACLWFFLFAILSTYTKWYLCSVIFTCVGCLFLLEANRYRIQWDDFSLSSNRTFKQTNLPISDIQTANLFTKDRGRGVIVQVLTIRSTANLINIDISLFHHTDITNLLITLTQTNPSIQLNELARYCEQGNVQKVQIIKKHKEIEYLVKIFSLATSVYWACLCTEWLSV